jgi:hypothetical protein
MAKPSVASRHGEGSQSGGRSAARGARSDRLDDSVDRSDDFGAFMDLLRAAEQFETSRSPRAERRPTLSPAQGNLPDDSSPAWAPRPTGPIGDSDGGNDIGAFMRLLRAAEQPVPSLGVTAGEELPLVRSSPDVSLLESAVLNAVARSLASAEGCVSLATHHSSWDGAQRVRDLTSTEMTRSGTMLQLLRFLKGEYRPARVTLSIAAVCERILELADAERRVRGIVVSVPSSFGDRRTVGDEALLTHVLLSLLLATFTLVQSVQNPVVTLSIEESVEGFWTVAIVQVQTSAPRSWSAPAPMTTALTDTDDALRLVALGSGHRVASVCGGRFVALAREGSTRISLDLPASTLLT